MLFVAFSIGIVGYPIAIKSGKMGKRTFWGGIFIGKRTFFDVIFIGKRT